MTLQLGFARVSTDKKEGREQTLGQQIDVLNDYGVSSENIYSEKIGGKINLDSGTQWLALKARALESTEPVEIVLVDWSRLSRDFFGFLHVVSSLASCGVVFTLPGDTRYQQWAPRDSFDGLNLAIEAFGAQLTREKTSQTTKAKLAHKKANGDILGRPRKLTDADRKYIKAQADAGQGYGVIAKLLSKKRTTAIPAEVRLIESNYVKALKHAKVSKSTVADELRKIRANETN